MIVDRIIGAFELCAKLGCYIAPEFKISKIAPESKDEIGLVSSLIDEVEKIIVPQSSTIGAAEKCAKLSKLIPEYCKRFKAVMEDTKTQQKMHSLVKRLQFMHKLESLTSEYVQGRVKEKSKVPLTPEAILSQDMTYTVQYPTIMLHELRMLEQLKSNIVRYREICSLLDKWKLQLGEDSLHKTSTGKILVFPSIKTEDAFEISLRLKAIANIKRIMNSDIEVDDDFAIDVEEEILVYKRRRPERASFCDDLFIFIIINFCLVNLQLSEGIDKRDDSALWDRSRYIVDLDTLAKKDFMHSINNLYLNISSVDFKNVWQIYFNKCKSIEAECISEKATDEAMSLCNGLVDTIEDVKSGTSAFSLNREQYAEIIDIDPNDIWNNYIHIQERLKSPESEKSFMDVWHNRLKDKALPLPEKEKAATFLPPTLKNSDAKAKRRKKRANAKKKVSQVVDQIVKPCVSSADPQLKTITGKVEKLTIKVPKVAPKGKKSIQRSISDDFNKQFPEPKLQLHYRVRRWKGDDVVKIFDVDPTYNQKDFSERTKKRIIFEHGFADAVAAVAMKEGNITTYKADEEKYGAVKRVQVVGEVVFDGTEERVQGVFSFSQGKNGFWFHVGFTPQESEASCKNYLKTGLYCVEYPVLSKDSRDAVLSKDVHEVLKDGSFIQSVSDHVVIIKDPAHAATIYLARVK